ncbi:MAG: hypothetical protein ABEH80_06560 [Halobaculum sp.]
MRRRQLLALIGIGGLAGCTTSGGGAGGGDRATGEETTTPTDTATPASLGEGTVTETSPDTETPQERKTPRETATPQKTVTPRETETPRKTATPTATQTESEAIAAASLDRTGDCAASSAGTASVSTTGDTVVVEGCIEGPTGCSHAAIQSTEYDPATGRLKLVVETVETQAVCTQQIVYRTYTARVQFAESLPTRVAVVHAGASDTTTVADERL